MKLVVTSSEDTASMNIKERLLDLGSWRGDGGSPRRPIDLMWS
ncbi:MAG: hypothetical protein WBC49_04035 [Thermoplasmata archaeon]